MKKKIKASLSVLLAAVILAACMPWSMAAEKEIVPVVMVSGYGATSLYLNEGTAEEEQVWSPDFGNVISQLLKEQLLPLLGGAVKATFGEIDSIVDTAGPYIASALEKIKLKDDGTSYYNVSPHEQTPENSSLAAQSANSDGTPMGDMSGVGATIGYKNVFNFSADWRKSQVDCAAEMNDFINAVMEYTNSDKVSIMGTSFGGQLTGTYLKLYGSDKLDKVLLNVPALGGTDIATQVIDGNIGLNLDLLLGMFSRNADLTWLSKIVDKDGLEYFCNKLISNYLNDTFSTIGSLWDFVPLKDYDAVRQTLIKNNQIGMLARSDELHYEIMAKHSETFASLKAQGVDISIIAGYGNNLLTDYAVNSDSVIPVYSSTGATAAQVGKALNFIGSPLPDHVSADRQIDASGAYLPDNTWFVSGLLHFGSVGGTYIKDLESKLLLTDELQSVNSSSAFPQFYTPENTAEKDSGIKAVLKAIFDGLTSFFRSIITAVLGIFSK